jgi:hypothetical protein
MHHFKMHRWFLTNTHPCNNLYKCLPSFINFIHQKKNQILSFLYSLHFYINFFTSFIYCVSLVLCEFDEGEFFPCFCLSFGACLLVFQLPWFADSSLHSLWLSFTWHFSSVHVCLFPHLSLRKDTVRLD